MTKQGKQGDGMAGNGVDVLCLAILALSMISSWRQGLIRVLGGVASLIVAFVMAALYYKSAAFWLEKQWGIQELLASAIRSHLPAVPVSMSHPVSYTGMADPVIYLAYLALLAISFLVILALITGLGNGVVLIVHRIFSGIGLGGADRLLGMAAGLLKALLIITLTIGIISPFARTGAEMGLSSAAGLSGLIDHSLTAHYLMPVYEKLQSWMGFGV